MSCTRTTQKELRALILRLDAELNDIGGTEQDRQEVLEDLAATAQDIMDEDNARSDLSITHNETGSILIAAVRDGQRVSETYFGYDEDEAVEKFNEKYPDPDPDSDEHNTECECGRLGHECKTWLGGDQHGDL